MQTPTMNSEQQRAILVIAQNALFADGAKHEREREQMRRIPESLGAETSAPDLANGKETASWLKYFFRSTAPATRFMQCGTPSMNSGITRRWKFIS